jgi:predicted solute-binding protein
MNILENASNEDILKFKLLCKDDKQTDEQVELVFLNIEICNEWEINEVVSILEQYRPNIFNKYNI